MFAVLCISNTDDEWPGFRTRRVPFSFLGGKRDYPEVSHTCWNFRYGQFLRNSDTVTLTTLSVARIIRLYHNVDMDNRNMSTERWKCNLWHRERWVLRTCPGTTLSTTNSTLSALGFNPRHSKEKPATERLSNGTVNLKTSVMQILNGYGVRVLHCLVSGLWHSYSEKDVPFRKRNCFFNHSSALS